jgi:hypothetical protein
MNLDLNSAFIDLSWIDARAAEGLIRKIILPRTDDKMDVELEEPAMQVVKRSVPETAPRRAKPYKGAANRGIKFTSSKPH